MNENKITVDLSNLSEDERKQLLTLIEKANKPKHTVCKPIRGDRYFSLDSTGISFNSRWDEDVCDSSRFNLGNCFKTEDEANFAVERLKVIAELKRFAEKYNPQEFKHNSFDIKWIIIYRWSNKDIEPTWVQSIYPMTSFATEEIAKAAIDEIGADRLKKYYFGISTESEA